MNAGRALNVVFGNVRRNKRAFVLSSVGLIIGVATLTFFIHLGMGVQDGVLNRIYPVNQIEVEPQTVGVVGLREQVVGEGRLGTDMVARFAALPDVTRVYPKLRSKLQARLWGGKALFGYAARAEAFFDGLAPDLLSRDLYAAERIDDKRARRKARPRTERCLADEECPLGQTCRLPEGVCGDVEYWERFTDRPVHLSCESGADVGCPEGQACAGGACAVLCAGAEARCPDGHACVPPPVCPSGACPGVCAPRCEAGAACADGLACAASITGQQVCQALACELASKEAQFSDRLSDQAGRVLGRCANGAEPGSDACEPERCPPQMYCAPLSVETTRGYCEHPIPVVLSPILIELFNSSAAAALGMQRIDGTEAMLGFQFRMHLGDSYFTADLPKSIQAVKRAEIVGFSDKAMEFGVTMPLSSVQAINARYKGTAAADTYDTFILETEGNEDVSELIAAVERLGFTLSRKSEDARKAADLLFILTVVFSFISVVIMFVAGVNIMHTFLTLVTERRYEIGIMRAVGATRADVRRLFLLEAGLLGLFGGVVGNLVSWGATRLVNWIAAEYLEGIPFKPEEFFVYDWRVMLGGVAFASVFCLIGAWLPARRAARLDPSVVLTS